MSNVGIGRLAAIGAIIVAILVVLVLLIGEGHSYSVQIRMQNGSQLVAGNELKVGGQSAGKISTIELDSNGRALMTVSVSSKFKPIPVGTRFVARSTSLSGVANHYLEMRLPAGAVSGGRGLPNGAIVDESQTTSSVDLDQIFNMLDAPTRRSLQKVIEGFAQSGRGIGNAGNRALLYANPLLSSSRRLFDELNRDDTTLERFVVDTARVTTTLDSRRDDISALVVNLDQSMGALAAESTSLERSIADLPNFLRRANTTFVNLRATLDDLDPLVNASKPAARSLRSFLPRLSRLAVRSVPVVKDLSRTISRRGRDNDLVDLTKLQVPLARVAAGPTTFQGKRKRGAFPEAVPALRNSLPALSFLRPYSPELVGWFDDFGHSGFLDANGATARIAAVFNAFSISTTTGLPQFGHVNTPVEQANGFFNQADTGNLRRCPGGNERPRDGSSPFTDGGNLDCDPSEIPPGN